MNNNPLVTFDEIVDALKSILECSISNQYTDELNYLNVKYESSIKNKVDTEKEKALYNAIKALEKNIDTYSKIIRNNLSNEVSGLEESIVRIESNYLIGQERRKLSAQEFFVKKLKDSSLKEAMLFNPIEDNIEEKNNLDDVDTNKIFSDFEKEIISNFPEYFQEEIELANDSNYLTSNYVIPEDINVKDINKINKLKAAIKKARSIGNKELIDKLEEKYYEELNK